MRLLGREKLFSLRGKDVDVDLWLSGWVNELINSKWKEAKDVFNSFPKAYMLHDNCFTFPIKEGHYHIQITFLFDRDIAFINKVVAK